MLCYDRKPCSGYKMKEMTGSGIFAGSSEDATENGKTGVRVYQVILVLFFFPCNSECKRATIDSCYYKPAASS